MSLSNNDHNYRLVAGEDIPENTAVRMSSTDGKVYKANGANDIITGIVPEVTPVNQRAPVIRGGTISELSGFSAGQLLRAQANGTLGTANASGSALAIAQVKAEDATTAVILSGNLDRRQGA